MDQDLWLMDVVQTMVAGLACPAARSNDMCMQDLLNAQSVDALVAGSLRVRQPYGDENEIRETGSEVGMNKDLTESGEQRNHSRRESAGDRQ